MIVTALTSVARNDRQAAHQGIWRRAKKKSTGITLLAREAGADGEQDDQRADENRVVRPGEHDPF
jgi:hypothetical protein